MKPRFLVVASHNPGKVREIAELLALWGVEANSAIDRSLGEPEETGATFSENAALKARAAAAETDQAALADDSGLVIPALNGAPGIYSARWAGPGKDFEEAIVRIKRELDNAAAVDFSAKFVCALALATPDGETKVFEGEVEGRLTFPPRGSKGFGYDPIFVAEGMRESFGELDPEVKHSISHRARAFAKLKAYLESGDAAV